MAPERMYQPRRDQQTHSPTPSAGTGPRGALENLHQRYGNASVRRLLEELPNHHRSPDSENHVIQRTKYQSVVHESGGLWGAIGASLFRRRGRVDVNDQNVNTLSARGVLYGRVQDGVYKADGDQEISIGGTLVWRDVPDQNMLLIEEVFAQPKRTSLGDLLIYHLALKALTLGRLYVGTALSALEEGTPEFYRKVGLSPFSTDPGTDIEAQAATLFAAEVAAGRFQNATPEEQVKRLLYIRYSASTRGRADQVRNMSWAALSRYWEVAAE